MDLLRSPLHWLFQSSSVPEAPVQQEMACTDDSDFIDIEEGLLMAEE